jgi:hypothetical protein
LELFTKGFDLMDLKESIACPSSIGLLHDVTPQLTFANVRAFVWAILLYQGHISISDALGSITPVCGTWELRTDWQDCSEEACDITRAQWLVEQVIGDMTASGILIYRVDTDDWELTTGENHKYLHEIIKAVSGLNASLPNNIKMSI